MTPRELVTELRSEPPSMERARRKLFIASSPAFPDLIEAAVRFRDHADAVLSGEISGDWADFYGPLFDDMTKLDAALAALCEKAASVERG